MIPIPNDIKLAIRNYILQQCPKATNGWKRANENEDALTADFLRGLITDGIIQTGDFLWELTYNKPRSQGEDSMEKLTGGDGIITIHVKDRINRIDYYKSVVFQAKKVGNPINPTQQKNLQNTFPGGFFNLEFSSSAYYGILPNGSKRGVCSLLAYTFLNCHIGIKDLHYDWQAKKYSLPNNMISQLKIPQELLIKIFR